MFGGRIGSKVISGLSSGFRNLANNVASSKNIQRTSNKPPVQRMTSSRKTGR